MSFSNRWDNDPHRRGTRVKRRDSCIGTPLNIVEAKGVRNHFQPLVSVEVEAKGVRNHFQPLVSVEVGESLLDR
jgi:hypothetical protein